MRVLRANHGFDYSFLYAIFMGNVLQPLNPHIGYADLVGHKLCADEHLISPSSSIWKLPRVALIIVKIIIALRHDYDFANLVSACLYQVMPITIRVLACKFLSIYHTSNQMTLTTFRRGNMWRYNLIDLVVNYYSVHRDNFLVLCDSSVVRELCSRRGRNLLFLCHFSLSLSRSSWAVRRAKSLSSANGNDLMRQ